jgi:hypothetical protein
MRKVTTDLDEYMVEHFRTRVHSASIIVYDMLCTLLQYCNTDTEVHLSSTGLVVYTVQVLARYFDSLK